MQITQFDKPVSILVGLGYPVKIHSAKQAYEFLSETRAISSKKAHSVALKACKAALEGEIEPETARSAFIAYAKRRAILMPEILREQTVHPGLRRAQCPKPDIETSGDLGNFHHVT